MLTNYLILSISTSIDSLGIGITYGIKNTRISIFSSVILFCISLLVTSISIYFGTLLSSIFPSHFTDKIGPIILVLIAISIILKSIIEYQKSDHSYYDFNHSNLIDPKEALILGLALSVDSFGIGITSSLMGISSYLFPFLVSIFQLLFLSFGNFLGQKVHKITCVPDFIWSFVSAGLLFIIGLIKLL